MEFKVGHLLFSKGSMLRVIGTGENHINVIEYSNMLNISNDMVTRTYSKVDGTWFQWGANGGTVVKLKKIGTIDPSKVPASVASFDGITSFDTIIIKGVPYKRVDETSLTVPEQWTNTFFLKNKSGEAILNIKKNETKSLYERAADAQFLTLAGIVSLKEKDVWTILRH